MAISLRAAGANLATNVAVTAINPSVPAGALPGDLSLLFAGGKPYGVVMNTDPAGWTKLGEEVSGTTANGTDAGTPKIGAWYDINAVVGAIGNMTFTGSPNTMNAVIETYDSDSGWIAPPVYTSGSDTSAAANGSITGGAWNVTAGDMIVVGVILNGDAGTNSALTIGGMSGATVGTVNTRCSFDVTTGNDNSLIVVDALITAGSSAAAPTFSYTNATLTSGLSAAIFVRLREGTAYTGPSTELDATATVGSDGRTVSETAFLVDGHVD